MSLPTMQRKHLELVAIEVERRTLGLRNSLASHELDLKAGQDKLSDQEHRAGVKPAKINKKDAGL